MKLDYLDGFSDPYLQTTTGRGVFLSGVVLGMMAQGQAGKGQDVDVAPLFKQLNFGKLQQRDLRRHLSRVPELVRAYRLDYAGMIESLAARAGECLIQGAQDELGVDGNFTFSVGFLNARNYFWKTFRRNQDDQNNQVEEISEQ